jgi:hypothetical protein
MKVVMRGATHDRAAFASGKLDALKIYSTISGDRHRGYDVLVCDTDYEKAKEVVSAN